MDRKSLLDEIYSQTLIMDSAIEAEDFEVFEGALEHRGELITALEIIGGNGGESERALLDEIAGIHSRCMEKLAALRGITSQQLDEARIARKNAQLAKGKYYDGYDGSGISIDIKK